MVAALHPLAGSGTVLTPLATESVVSDIVLGVGIAVALFVLYYVVVLRPARRPPPRRGAGNSPSRNDTEN